MTPSNPSNSQPLIYRIADALGVFHLVAPVNHTHAQSEIDGLTTALAAKANAADVTTALAAKANAADVTTALAGKMDNKTIDSAPANNADHLVSSKGVYDALAEKADSVHSHSSIDSGEASVSANYDTVEVEGRKFKITLEDGNGNEDYVEITEEDLVNFKRALQNPDSTPTASSDKLVTSGGVKAALNLKSPLADTQVQVHTLEIGQYGDITGIYVDDLFQSGNTQVSLIVDNLTGDDVEIDDAFGTYTQNDLSVMDEHTVIPAESIVACRIFKRATPNPYAGGHYYLIIDGIIQY